MSILLDKSNRVLIQGVTGQMGQFFVEDARKYGTNMVAGVSPGRAGTSVGDVPVFASVATACKETGADTAMVFVPPSAVLGATIEAIEAGCRLVVATADEMPVLDAIEVRAAARANGAVFVGPNTPGLISPGKAKMGFMPSFCYTQGSVGVISRSGSLSYEGSKRITLAGIGQTTVVGIGGDPVKGTEFIDILEMFLADEATKSIIMIGEIGGSAEEDAADFIKHSKIKKPMVGFIAGRTAPPGRRMGHAGAIISGGKGGAEDKIAAMEAAGIRVSPSPAALGQTLVELLKSL
jgi:succinyl-CoA synthetase alpha subunit